MADLYSIISETLARKYTSPIGRRNPEWNGELPDDPKTNPYYLSVAMGDRITQTMYVTNRDESAGVSVSSPSITEVTEVIVEALAIRGVLRCSDCGLAVKETKDGFWHKSDNAGTRHPVKNVYLRLNL